MEMANRDDLGMIWMGDMLLAHDSNEMMLDSQSGSPFFTDSPHPLEEMRGRVPLEMEGFPMLDEYDSLCEEAPRFLTSTATQTTAIQTHQPARKIKPIKHPGLKLKTPIAYQKDTDPSVIPIQKDGMAVCEQCGAIGVKHAFYTKERRFCSLACAREFSEKSGQHNTKSQSLSYSPHMEEVVIKQEPKQEKLETNQSTSQLPPLSLDDPPSPVMAKRNRAELANTYDWRNQLSEPGFIAAPVSCFKHAPLADCWENITVGMKVEVENTDCDDFTESFPDSFWVATVLRIAGYKALLRYEGFGQNSSKDFWVSLCSNSVHPVGWCATRGKPLIPPKTIEDKYKDWKEFLVKRLTGARTLPSNFYNKVTDSLSSRFRSGLNLEVVDKNRISQVKVAKIRRIVGKRLHVQYYDAEPDDNGFWCHEDSPLIHPVGWACRVGHAIDAPQEYLERCEDGCWHEDDATDQYFCCPLSVPVPPGVCFQEGMKLEAIDPLNLSAICVATVMKVLRGDYVMIRIDSYDEDASGADWFCYHASSPCIFPAGFCDVNSIPLTPPKGYEPNEFDWSTYLEESNLTTAPLALFNREIPPHGFVEGMRLEAADLMDPRLVCVGTVSRVVGRLLKVHFDGWEEEYDQWLDCESPDMYPVGWCHLVCHKLEGPRTATNKASSTAGKSPKSVKKRPRRRHRKPKVSPGGGSGIKKTPNNNSLISRTGNSQIWLVKAVKIIGQEFNVRGTPPAAISSGTNSNGSSNECMPREPAQATKAASTESCSEGLPKEASNGLPAPGCEPEMGQEPAGPDQSLPVSSEPTQSQQPPLPRERTATSYINSMAASGKLIPRLIDSTGSIGEPGELVPVEWNVFDVAQFLRVNDCAAYCDSFSRRKIDGKTLLTLTKDQIIDLTGMKVGPSLKIFDLIQQLKIKINPAQERMKASLKKLL